MPTITQIKQQKNKNRLNVYLDGKFGFGIDLENFVKLGLRVEQDLTPDEIDRITRKSEFQITFDKLLRFAMIRPRSQKEITLWFRRKKVPDEFWNKLNFRLRKLELLDDEKFARWWVQQRSEFKPKSKLVIKGELLTKGIEKNIIDDVLDETIIDEISIAKNLIFKNSYKWQKFDQYTAKRKMVEYLARKGFSWDTIKSTIKLQIDDDGHQ